MSNLHRKTLMMTIRKACNPKDECDDKPPQPPKLENHPVSPLKIIMICTLAATFLFICYIIIIKTCRALKTRRRRRIRLSHGNTVQTHQDFIDEDHEPVSHGNTDQTHQDFVDEDHEPVVFHPIWLINTVGLDQSVIDSIEMFKYRKEDGLIIDGTGSDCAVCLGSFQEEESLRLLPKCSHAFHVTCIDTWLRSHKNCPLCRAPIVNNTSNHQIDQNFAESSAQEEIPFVAPQNEIIGVENCQEIDSNGESSEKTSFTSGVRVQNNLTDHLCQPIRRSVSLGSFCSVDQEGGELAVSQKPNVVPKSAKPIRSSSSISIYKRVVKSSSFGPTIDLEEVSSLSTVS